MDNVYKEIYNTWNKFINNQPYDSNCVRSVILESWLRSRDYGLDPYSRSAYKPFKDLKKLREENKQLFGIAKPFMKVVDSFIKGSGFIVILIDPNGYVIDLIGDKEVLKAAEENYLVPGANRQEDSVGTNAIALALKEKQPIQIFGPEHYNFYHHSWTCSSAPIHDSSGNIIGIFNMSGHYSLLHKHTLGMVVSIVRAIERELNLHEAHKDAVLMNKYLGAIINSISEGIIAVDSHGKILQANTNASLMLGYDEVKLDSKDITDLLSEYSTFLNLFKSKILYVDKEFSFKKGYKYNHCLVTSTPIKDSQGENMGVVAVLREKQKVHNLVHRIVGASACYTFNDIIGENQKIKECLQLAKKCSKTDCKILIEGESGTGKELYAQAIHNYSDRSEGPFIAVNCGAVPRELIESELFGYEEGAFTGASKRGKPGKFELAEGGTLFLDEVTSMPFDMQAKLLRVLQENQLMRLGSIEPIPLNIRIVASTNCDLRELIKEKSFREDLYYRLSVMTICIPPLRERKEDIPLLAQHIINKLCAKTNSHIVPINQEAMCIIINYDWPGNVRELENVLERAIVLCNNNGITQAHLPDNIKKHTSVHSEPYAITIQQDSNLLNSVENRLIKKVLKINSGNISKTAKELGISRNTIYKRIKTWETDR